MIVREPSPGADVFGLYCVAIDLQCLGYKVAERCD